MLSLNQCRDILNRYINEIHLPEFPRNLYEPVKYMLGLEAKRLRPALVLMSCNIYTEEITCAIYPALAIEVFHNFTLVHDDIMDRSSLRRGYPTVHVKWNSSIAILSGDAMLIKAYELLSHPSVSNPGQLLPVFNETALKVCEGQQYDMDYENSNTPLSIKDYLNMVEYKTAVLIAAALKIGAFTGGAENEDAGQLYEFGRHIGIAFQLQDDLLDAYADTGLFGKVTGNDIVTNKKTILLVEAMNSSNPGIRQELLHWITKKDFDRNEKVNAVMGLYSSLGLKQNVEEMIAFYYQTALQHLDNLQVPEERKSELRSFSEQLMRRNK